MFVLTGIVSLLRSVYERRDEPFAGLAELIYSIYIALIAGACILMLLAPAQLVEAFR